MTPDPARLEYIEGRLVDDVSDADYFALDGLSHSDTKLLDRSPAFYRWVKDNRKPFHKSEFDFGHVVHELALGKGSGIDVIDADDWRTKAAKDARDESRANGRTPILTADYERAATCAAAIDGHPIAAKLLKHTDHREIAMTWDHDGVALKAKLDAVTGKFGVDLKTTDNADTDAFGRSAGKFGYASQDAWYREALRRCLGIDDPQFLFVVIEREPPHLVNVIQLDSYDVDLGARRNHRMIELYRRCRDADHWPAYGEGINTAQLPRWAELEMEGE